MEAPCLFLSIMSNVIIFINTKRKFVNICYQQAANYKLQNRRRPAAKGQKASRRQKRFRRIELKPGETNCCRRPAATVPRRRRGQGRPLGQQGGAPDPLPSKDGSPQQQSRQATGQKADNESYECIICQATCLRHGIRAKHPIHCLEKMLQEAELIALRLPARSPVGACTKCAEQS